MPRPASREPTERELDILRVLWETGPAALSEVCAVLRRDRGVATTTVATMLKVMLDKGLVRRTGDRRWQAAVSRKTTGQGMVRRLLDQVFDGSAQRMVAHVLEAGRLDDRDIQQLQDLLDEYRSSPRPRRE